MVATFPQSWHECQIRYHCDDNHQQEKMKLDAPERYDYQRDDEKGNGDIFFDMPHKKYRTSLEDKKLWTVDQV